MDEIRFNSIQPPDLQNTAAAGPNAMQTSVQGGGGFLGTLKEAIAETNELQLEATAAVDRIATGENQSLHQTLVALQKADVSFQLMMQIRNKIVTAYEEIQRMQV